MGGKIIHFFEFGVCGGNRGSCSGWDTRGLETGGGGGGGGGRGGR